MLLLAATTFAAASGIHYQTPMLGAMAAEFGADSAAIGITYVFRGTRSAEEAAYDELFR